MVKVVIGKEERDLRDTPAVWLRSSIEILRRSASPLCVKVRIVEGEIDMILATPGCPSGEEGRPYRGEELKIFENWRNKKLDTDNFTARDLEEFLASFRKH
jgi:hypothetical protein